MKKWVKKASVLALSAVLAAAPASCIGSVSVLAAESEEQTKTTVTNQDIVDYAVSWVGKIQYALGANGELSDGGSSDCSWFIYRVFHHFGLMDQYTRSVGWGAGKVPNAKNIGTNIADAIPGDVEFWDEGNNAGHVAIYIGDGKAVACNGYFTPDYMRTHNGHVGEVEITSYKTTIGRDPDSIWRVYSNGNVNYAYTDGESVLHRLYHRSTGEHLYTTDSREEAALVAAGWKDEGKAWDSPEKSEHPVYRLYNPNTTEHHFTIHAGERDALVKFGWRYEGIGWYSDDEETVPVYRLYNPNAYSMNHHYTTNAAERDMLVRLGWRDEGIGWYAVK